jgi:hypothetical protein
MKMDRRIHAHVPALILFALGSIAGAANHLLLSLDFSDSTALGKQTDSSLPILAKIYDPTPSKQYPGSVDFGTRGLLKGQMRHPAGPFTVEARFLFRDYAIQSAPYLSDLVSTGNWEDGRTPQGFSFRIGGGYLYPVLPKGAYDLESLYSKSLTVGQGERAWLSRCLGEFTFATKPGGTAQWLEVYTDRCLEPGTWNHMVAVWDGNAAHIYVNGKDATDMWRLNGSGSQPLLDSVVTVNVGARTDLMSDQRHLNGMIDYIRVLDTAMSETEIHARYSETLPPDTHESACRGSILPVSPAAGAFCDSGCGFKLKLDSFGACLQELQAWELSPSDSMEVEFSKDPDFHAPFLHFTVPDTTFQIGTVLAGIGEVFTGEACYWRVRLKPKAVGLAKTGALAFGAEWSDPKPFYFSYAKPVGVAAAVRPEAAFKLKAVQGGYLLSGWRDAMAPRIYDLGGKAVEVKATRLANGEWMLASRWGTVPGSRLSVLKTAQGAVPILF